MAAWHECITFIHYRWLSCSTRQQVAALNTEYAASWKWSRAMHCWKIILVVSTWLRWHCSCCCILFHVMGQTLCVITFIFDTAEVFQNNAILVQHVLLWLLGNQIDLASWYIVFDYIEWTSLPNTWHQDTLYLITLSEHHCLIHGIMIHCIWLHWVNIIA